MAEFKAGQRIKVEYTGIVPEFGQGTDARLLFEGKYIHVRPLDDIKVTLLAPADWPPQVGDIWEAEGREYYVRGSTIRSGVIIEPFNTANPGPKWQFHDELLDDFKALNPALVRRRGR